MQDTQKTVFWCGGAQLTRLRSSPVDYVRRGQESKLSLMVGMDQLCAELDVNNVNTNMNIAHIRMNKYSLYSYSHRRI